MAERKPLRTFASALRFAEKKLPLTRDGARERRKYKKRVSALSQPEDSSIFYQEMQHIKMLVDTLVPNSLRPQLEAFETIALVSDVFVNPNQAIDSDHNVSHMAITATLSVLRGRQLVASGLVESKDINEKALWVGSLLHDTQRRGDLLDSIPPLLRRHGIKGAQKANDLMRKMHIPEGEGANMLPIVKQMLQYHDSRRGICKPALKELEILEFTDRMTLGRLFESQHTLIRLAAGEITAKRMRRYPEVDAATRDSFVTPGDIAIYSQVAGAMDTLVKKRIKQKGLTQPQDMFKETLAVAKELGLFKTFTEGETDPHLVVLPTAA